MKIWRRLYNGYQVVNAVRFATEIYIFRLPYGERRDVWPLQPGQISSISLITLPILRPNSQRLDRPPKTFIFLAVNKKSDVMERA